MNARRLKNLACAGLALLACASTPLLAQSLGAASSFAVEGFAGVTAAGAAGTVVTGDVGSSPSASITGFPPALVAPPFGLHPNDAAAIAAQAADVTLFTTLGTGACTDNLGAQLGRLVAYRRAVCCRHDARNVHDAQRARPLKYRN